MKNISFVLLLISLYSFSCNSKLHGLFVKQTPHEEYADKLDDKGLDKTPEGKAWLAASHLALERPITISLPYYQQGFFQPDKPRAMGLQFAAKAGEELVFTLSKKGGVPLSIYADVFKSDQTTEALLSADTASKEFSFAADEAGTYLLRLQPALFQSGEYSLSISVRPSLGFPVAGTKASIGSVWGDDRDGGKRSHEGIDIFAPKLTPAVAAADGYITGVREGGIGGKTVWLRPNNKPYTLYYAHLDKQAVQEGQQVKKGDVVGLVGNTGNAQFTPSHLHFGVYTAGGAIDPLPFVNRTVKTASVFAAKKFMTYLQLTKAQKLPDGSLVKASTHLLPLAANEQGYLAEIPDGRLLQVPFSQVKTTKEPVVKSTNGLASATPATNPKS